LRQQGKLYNGDGEIIAEGPCELDEEGSRVSMWPIQEKALFERERGLLTLVLDGGKALCISERRLRLRINRTHGPSAAIYRMQVEPQSAGQAGPPAPQADLPSTEEPDGVPDHLRRVDPSAGLTNSGAPQAEPSGGLSTAP
jgi:hypothetical protein